MANYLYEFKDDNDNVVGQYKADHRLSEIEVNNVHDSYAEAGFLNPENTQKEEYSTKDLLQNTGLHNAFKTYWKRHEGKDFEGTTEELIDEYKEQMRYYETNLMSITKLAGELGSDFYNEDERQALAVMWGTWENTMPFYNEENGKWDAFWDFAEAGATDLTNWAGLFTGGTATAGSIAAKQAAKAGIRQLIATGIKQGSWQGVKQGALWALPQSVGRQYATGELGIGDGVDLAETAKDVGIGAGFGGTLGGTLGGVAGARAGSKAAKTAAKAAKLADDAAKVGDEIATDKKTVDAILDWSQTLGDVNVSGAVRQQARKKFFNEIAEGFRNRITGKSDVGKTYTFEESRDLALKMLKDTGYNIEDATFEGVIAHMKKTYDGGKVPANMSDHFNALVYQMEAIAIKKFQKGWKANDPNAIKWMQSLQDSIALSETVSNRAGRALAITKMRQRLDTKTYAEVMDNLTRLGADRDDMAAYLAKASEKGGTWRGKSVDALNEFWIHNILGAFNTLFINTGGSYLHMLERAGIEIASGAKNAITGKGTVQLRNGVVQLMTEHANIFGALRYSLKAFNRGISQLDPARTVDELADSIVIGNRNFDFSNPKSLLPQKGEGVGTYAANWAGNANRLIGGRGMAATDEFIKQMAFRGKLFSRILDDKLKTAKSFKDYPRLIKEARKEAQDLLDIHIDSIGKGVRSDDPRIREALEEARVTTFQNDFKDDIFGHLGKSTGAFVNKHPVMRQIMPFIRTPANLLSHFAERTPGLQNTSNELKRMLSSSNPAMRARAETIMNIGTLMWVHAFYMASQDELQGDGMVDYDRQKTNAMSDANLPNSMKLEDGTLIGFRKLDPYSRPYRIVANLFDAFKYADGETQLEQFTKISGATMKALIDMPTTQGITDLAGIIQTMQSDQGTLGNVIDKKVGSMLPYARFVDEIFRLSGNEQELYEIMGVGDTVLEKGADYFDKQAKKTYPWLRDPSDPVDKRRDPLTGHALTKPQEFGFEISGIPTKEGKASALSEEISRLGMVIQPPTPVYGGTVDLRKYTVKPDGTQSVYDYWWDLTGRIKIAGYGNEEQYKKGATLQEALTHLVTDNAMYREVLRDSDRYFATKDRDQNGREKEIRKVIAHYRNTALAELQKPEHLGKSHPVIKEMAMAKIEIQTNDTFQSREGANVMKQQVQDILTGE